MQNPFENLENQITELSEKIDVLIRKPQEDTSKKMYTIKEASILLRVGTQSIRNYIKRGEIKALTTGRRLIIPHNELFNSLNEVKSLKYKR